MRRTTAMQRRLETLEAAAWNRLTPAERAEERIGRGERFEALTDEELEAFIGDAAAYLRELPTPLIEAILAMPGEDETPLVTLRQAFEAGPATFADALASAERQYLDSRVACD
jgi:hypothetical protein